MITKYGMADQVWYDIKDYGMEGTLEGLSYDELLRLNDEIAQVLDGKEPFDFKPGRLD